MSELYNNSEKKIKKIAESCEITDSWEIRKMICEIQKEIQKNAEELVDSLNIMGGDVQEALVKGFLAGVNRSHRYLQNEFWMSMKKIIKEYGDNEFFDARNAQSVKMCKRMAVAAEKWSE